MMLKACVLLALAAVALGRNKDLIEVNEENWKQILKGEWMIEFHAPWCPACKEMSKTWDSFASWSKDLAIKVGDIDVTANPGLSGRFLVTALPTIYHVKEGVFRLYQGPRDKEDFMKFIEDKKWTVVDPISSWKNPESMQMSVVAAFFRASMHVRDLHTYLVEQKGLPPLASYALFGLATLLLGCILGFVIVMLIDCAFPAGKVEPKTGVPKKDVKKKQREEKKRKEEERAKESQSEHGSQSEHASAASSAEESADESKQKVTERKKHEKKESPKKESPKKEDKKKK